MKKYNVKNYLSLYFKSFKYLWRASKSNVFVLLLVIPLQALLPSITLYIANYLIDNVYSLSNKILYIVLAAWGFSFLLNNVFAPLVTLVQGKLTDDLTFKLNYDIMKKSEEIETIDYYEDHNFYNDIEILSSESSWRPVNLLVFGTSIISNAILFVSMLFIFASFHVLIALAMLFVLVPQAIIAYSLQAQAFETLVSNSEESRKLEYYSQTLLSSKSIKEVRLYNLYKFFIDKYTVSFNKIKKGVHKERKKKFRNSLFFLIVTALISVGTFIYIIYSIRKGSLGLGAIMLFASSVVYAMNSMSRLIEDSSLLYDTLLYMEKFFKFNEIKTDVECGKLEMPDDIDSIEFKNISFTYPNGDKEALNNISFSVNKGEKIAIVGENGAGKTTLVKLLSRFYKIDDGDILINGVPISNFSYEAYREKIAAIFQDFAKFDLSIRENIVISDLNKKENKDEIELALKKSGFYKDFTANLDKVLGQRFEDSTDISGGQWQRLALARAFYSGAPILILDEPTSALDARIEYEIFQKFLELTEGKTVFFITHRLASVRQADKILILKDGRVEAFDDHETLMKSDAYYRELYEMQSSLYYKK